MKQGKETNVVQLPDELLELLADAASLKVLATTGLDGAPHVVVRGSLQVLDGGDLAFAEEMDSSQASKDLVFAIWNDRPVALAVCRGPEVWEIRGRPWRCLVTGPVFKRFLLQVRAHDGPDADVSTVWVIRPEDVINQSPAVLRERDAEQRPYAGSHLDRASLVRRESEASAP